MLVVQLGGALLIIIVTPTLVVEITSAHMVYLIYIEIRSTQQRYTLHPYTPWTPYDWDPVYKKKIAVGKDTWRGPYWKMLHVSDIKGMTNTGHIKLEKKESLVRFENGMLVGDYATLLTQYFTREFWRFRAKKNRKDTKEALEEMGRTLSDEH